MGRTPAPGFPVFTVAVQPDETCHPLRCSAFPASKISLTRTCAVASVRCGSRCRGAASPDPAECRRSETWRREAMLTMQIQEAARANRKFFAAGGLRAGGAALPTVSLRTTTDRPPRSGPIPRRHNSSLSWSRWPSVGSAIRSARRAKCMRRSLAVPDDYGRPPTQTDRMGDAIGDRGSPAAGFDHHPSVCPPVAPAAESSCQTPADSTVYRGCGAKRRVGLAPTRSAASSQRTLVACIMMFRVSRFGPIYPQPATARRAITPTR